MVHENTNKIKLQQSLCSPSGLHNTTPTPITQNHKTIKSFFILAGQLLSRYSQTNTNHKLTSLHVPIMFSSVGVSEQVSLFSLGPFNPCEIQSDVIYKRLLLTYANTCTNTTLIQCRNQRTVRLVASTHARSITAWLEQLFKQSASHFPRKHFRCFAACVYHNVVQRTSTVRLETPLHNRYSPVTDFRIIQEDAGRGQTVICQIDCRDSPTIAATRFTRRYSTVGSQLGSVELYTLPTRTHVSPGVYAAWHIFECFIVCCSWLLSEPLVARAILAIE